MDSIRQWRRNLDIFGACCVDWTVSGIAMDVFFAMMSHGGAQFISDLYETKTNIGSTRLTIYKGIQEKRE